MQGDSFLYLLVESDQRSITMENYTCFLNFDRPRAIFYAGTSYTVIHTRVSYRGVQLHPSIFVEDLICTYIILKISLKVLTDL